jgi:hypothetical protein
MDPVVSNLVAIFDGKRSESVAGIIVEVLIEAEGYEKGGQEESEEVEASMGVFYGMGVLSHDKGDRAQCVSKAEGESKSRLPGRDS